MSEEESSLLDYNRIFYAASAFFAVLAVLYFGFEYIQNLSPVTISGFTFAIFAASFIRGVTRESKGVKFLYYLLSTGSYLVFIAYTNARLISTENGVLASLIFSAALFSSIGYVLTNKKEIIPSNKQSKKILIGIAAFILVLTFYDGVATGYSVEYQLEDEVVLSEEEIRVGEAEIIKTGYLPIDIESKRARFCTIVRDEEIGMGGHSVGGHLSSYIPETNKENLTMTYSEGYRDEELNISNQELEVIEVDTCARDETTVEEGQLGVEIDANGPNSPQI